MMLYDWWHLTLQQVAETDWVQWLAVALGIAEVLLAKVNNIALYPAGIASTILAVYILLTAGLYAESLLNGYYIVMSIYGWWFWIKKKNEPPVQISRCSRNDWLTVMGITVGSFVATGVIAFKIYTLNGACLGCVGKRNSMGGNVAAGKTKNRKLDIAECLQYMRNTIIIL